MLIKDMIIYLATVTLGGCLLKKDPGPCDEVERVFYFDVDTGVCEAFEYGGCEGNENRFGSREECLKACDPDSTSVQLCSFG